MLVQTDQYGNSTRFKPVRSTGLSGNVPVAPVSPTSSNQAHVVYEVYAVEEALKSGGDSLQLASIPVSVAFISNTGQNLPSLGQITVSASLAPAGPLAPNTTFGEASMPRNAFAINSVISSLLFPFVTNQNGLDTRIVIANTSLDPFGTTTQAGKVTLFYYGGIEPGDGKAPPVNMTTGTGTRAGIVPAGCQLVFTLGDGGGVSNCAALGTSTTTIGPTPGFQGYIIAVCQFQYCHGFALIGRRGSESQAYLAVSLRRDGPPSEV